MESEVLNGFLVRWDEAGRCMKFLVLVLLLLQAMVILELRRQAFSIWRLEDTMKVVGENKWVGIYEVWPRRR